MHSGMRVTARLAEIALAAQHPSRLQKIIRDVVLELQPYEQQKE
jgi:hypothetical protein